MTDLNNANAAVTARAPASRRGWMFLTAGLVAVFVVVHLAFLGAPYVNLESWTGAAALKAYSGDWLGAIDAYQTAVSSPPFAYWSIVPFFMLFGPSEASARFPTLLAALLTMFAIFVYVRSRFEGNTAFLATVLIAANPLLWGFSGIICCNDVPFALTTALLMIALAEADRIRKTRADTIAGFALGLALVTKFVAAVYPLAVAFLLVRRVVSDGGAGRVTRFVKLAAAYVPGVSVAALAFVWLYVVRGQIVSTQISPARVDLLSSFLVLTPARLAYYVCWVGLCAGPLALVAVDATHRSLGTKRMLKLAAGFALANILALAAMSAAATFNEMALGEMRLGYLENALPGPAVLGVEFLALFAGEAVLVAMFLWGREKPSPNGSIMYWTVSILLLISTWRGAQRYLVYLLPGLLICLADLALRPDATHSRRRLIAIACTAAVIAGVTQGAFTTAYFAAEGEAAARVARFVNESHLAGLEYEISNPVLCHCSYLVDPDLFAPPGAPAQYIMKNYSRQDPASDALFVEDVRLLGVVWKRYGVVPAAGGPATPAHGEAAGSR